MCPCSSCRGGGGLAPRATRAPTLLPPAIPPWAEDRGRCRCCTLTSAAKRVHQGCPGMRRVSQAGLCPGAGAARPPHLWGTHPALLAHTGDWWLPRDVPSVLPTQGAGHQPRLSAHPHTLQGVHVHPSHSSSCPKGSPGPSALTTGPSCRKRTYSSSQRHKTPHIPVMLFPHLPHHHQPSLQTHCLLPCCSHLLWGSQECLAQLKKNF